MRAFSHEGRARRTQPLTAARRKIASRLRAYARVGRGAIVESDAVAVSHTACASSSLFFLKAKPNLSEISPEQSLESHGNEAGDATNRRGGRREPAPRVDLLPLFSRPSDTAHTFPPRGSPTPGARPPPPRVPPTSTPSLHPSPHQKYALISFSALAFLIQRDTRSALSSPSRRQLTRTPFAAAVPSVLSRLRSRALRWSTRSKVLVRRGSASFSKSITSRFVLRRRKSSPNAQEEWVVVDGDNDPAADPSKYEILETVSHQEDDEDAAQDGEEDFYASNSIMISGLGRGGNNNDTTIADEELSFALPPAPAVHQQAFDETDVGSTIRVPTQFNFDVSEVTTMQQQPARAEEVEAKEQDSVESASIESGNDQVLTTMPSPSRDVVLAATTTTTLEEPSNIPHAAAEETMFVLGAITGMEMTALETVLPAEPVAAAPTAEAEQVSEAPQEAETQPEAPEEQQAQPQQPQQPELSVVESAASQISTSSAGSARPQRQTSALFASIRERFESKSVNQQPIRLPTEPVLAYASKSRNGSVVSTSASVKSWTKAAEGFVTPVETPNTSFESSAEDSFLSADSSTSQLSQKIETNDAPKESEVSSIKVDDALKQQPEVSSQVDDALKQPELASKIADVSRTIVQSDVPAARDASDETLTPDSVRSILMGVASKPYKSQAVHFLNAFWSTHFESSPENKEKVWAFTQKFQELDVVRGAQGCEIEEIRAHQAVEKLAEALTHSEMRSKFHVQNRHVSLLDTLMFIFSADPETCATAPQSAQGALELLRQAEQLMTTSGSALASAQDALSAAGTAETEASKGAAVAAEAARVAATSAEASKSHEALVAAAEANALQRETRAAEAATQAAEAFARSAAAAEEAEAARVAALRATESAAEAARSAGEAETRAQNEEQAAIVSAAEAFQRETASRVAEEKAFDAEKLALEAKLRVDQALERVKQEEAVLAARLQSLEAKAADPALGLVARRTAEHELQSLRACDPKDPLTRARLSAEAAARKHDKFVHDSSASRAAFVAARASAELGRVEAEKARATAEAALETARVRKSASETKYDLALTSQTAADDAADRAGTEARLAAESKAQAEASLGEAQEARASATSARLEAEAATAEALRRAKEAAECEFNAKESEVKAEYKRKEAEVAVESAAQAYAKAQRFVKRVQTQTSSGSGAFWFALREMQETKKFASKSMLKKLEELEMETLAEMTQVA